MNAVKYNMIKVRTLIDGGTTWKQLPVSPTTTKAAAALAMKEVGAGAKAAQVVRLRGSNAKDMKIEVVEQFGDVTDDGGLKARTIGERIIDFLVGAKVRATANEIAKHIEAKPDSVRVALARLVKAGEVVRREEGKEVVFSAKATGAAALAAVVAQAAEAGPPTEAHASAEQAAVTANAVKNDGENVEALLTKRGAKEEHVFLLRTGWEDGAEVGLREAAARLSVKVRLPALLKTAKKLVDARQHSMNSGEALFNALGVLIEEERDRALKEIPTPVSIAKSSSRRMSVEGSATVKVRVNPAGVAHCVVNLPGGAERFPLGSVLVVKEIVVDGVAMIALMKGGA
jgi:hypothetical protein